jgi:tagaturonate epimerase
MIQLGKYSMGLGDRFAMQGAYQLRAIMDAAEKGILITPIWNKSNREHQIIHSEPSDTRKEADAAVQLCSWKHAYFVDADHININNVDRFISSSDFFTIDVADYIGQEADPASIDEFVKKNQGFSGKLVIPGLNRDFFVTKDDLYSIGKKFLYAIEKADEIYSTIASKKGEGNFITEISMDEVDFPQTPLELFFILSAISMYDIPVQTIAPKFTGRFNKGVDYEGDIDQFRQEFEEDILVIDYAIEEFGLPSNLKLSIHSGSDKFSIYPVMSELIHKHNKGIHVKTAGTTWLEEVIGLAEAGGEALSLAKSIYRKAYDKREELCKPYATVIDINFNELPSPDEVDSWGGSRYASALRHIPENQYYDPNLRQLVHVGYKVAAEYGNIYINQIKANEEIVGRQVYENILNRHIARLFNL